MTDKNNEKAHPLLRKFQEEKVKDDGIQQFPMKKVRDIKKETEESYTKGLEEKRMMLEEENKILKIKAWIYLGIIFGLLIVTATLFIMWGTNQETPHRQSNEQLWGSDMKESSFIQIDLGLGDFFLNSSKEQKKPESDQRSQSVEPLNAS